MFLKPKRVSTKKTFIRRREQLKIPQQHIDKVNREIYESCKKRQQELRYRQG